MKEMMKAWVQKEFDGDTGINGSFLALDEKDQDDILERVQQALEDIIDNSILIQDVIHCWREAPENEGFACIPATAQPLPEGITPGWYTRNEMVGLLRDHKNDPRAIQFLADMLEV